MVLCFISTRESRVTGASKEEGGDIGGDKGGKEEGGEEEGGEGEGGEGEDVIIARRTIEHGKIELPSPLTIEG